MKETIELESLLGEHVLDAVDMFEEDMKARYGDYTDHCQIFRFRLDGKVYTAIEDPSDGYRSSMGELFVSDDAMKNVFPPIRVVAKKKAPGYGENDTLEFIDATTGKVVAEVGTDNSDDHYPSFVGAFFPANMATNAG